MVLHLSFKKKNKAFLKLYLLLNSNFIYFLVYYFKFSFLVFPGVTICDIPSDCCKCFTFMCKCFIIEKKL